MQAISAGSVWADADVLAAERARAVERLAQEQVQAVEEAPEGLQRELATLRSQIAEANQRLTIENRVLNNRQRELEREDPIAKGLREKVLEREKQLIELRRSLQSRLKAIPEIQELERKRAELVEQVKVLREQERALLKSGATENSTLRTGK